MSAHPDRAGEKRRSEPKGGTFAVLSPFSGGRVVYPKVPEVQRTDPAVTTLTCDGGVLVMGWGTSILHEMVCLHFKKCQSLFRSWIPVAGIEFRVRAQC